MDPKDPAYRGQAGYTPLLLAVYDPFVLGFMARVVWRCPIPPVLDRYRRHLGRRHLDIGPGTGYFLEKAELAPEAEVTLLDPNPNVLARASRRLAPLEVSAVEADVLKPLPVEGPFDSVALSLVLHCLPGPQRHKGCRHQKHRRRPRTGWRLVRGDSPGRLRTPHCPARAVLRAFNWQGGLRQPGGHRRRAARDPGGVVSER